jgi:hypothetical protein
MKLTPQEIELIDDTLVLNGLIYEDIKLEVIDHIASEIEEKLTLEQVSFEAAFKEIFENWKNELRPKTYSFLLGNHIVGPKIIMDKMANNKKQELMIEGFLVVLLTIIFIGSYIVTLNKYFLFQVENILTVLTQLGSVLLLGTKIFLSRSNIKTSYKFRFDKGFFLTIMYGLSRSLGVFPSVSKYEIHEKIVGYSFTIAFGILVLLIILNSLRLAYKHLEFERKLAKI